MLPSPTAPVPVQPLVDGAQIRAAGVVALRVVVSARTQFGTVVGQIVRQRLQAFVVVSDVCHFNERAKLQELMQTTRLPVAYGARERVTAGGLLSYAANTAANFRHSAEYVDKILKGVKPADLPVDHDQIELVIDLKIAKALGLTIPQTVLLRADEVI